ncbi:hypothetical protein MLD52_08215 [Puniceicoccaceae bacterium K14]|nr:hypothetical protein [Puniceicoccaceae bacterium K14]
MIGDEFRFGQGKIRTNAVRGWETEKQKLTWPVYLQESGTYAVEAEYSLKEGAPLNQYSVTISGNKLTAMTESTGTAKNATFAKQKIGQIEISKGQQLLEIFSEGIPDEDLMYLRALHLTPIPPSS